MMPYVLIAAGLGLLAWLLGQPSSKAAVVSPPGPPPAPPPKPPPDKPPKPPVDGGRAFVLSLPEQGTPSNIAARDELIWTAITQGFAPPLRWTPLTSHLGANKVTFYVTEDALAVGLPQDWVRVNVRHDTAQRLADYYGALLPTTKISDLAWLASNNPGSTRLRAHPIPPSPQMANTSQMLAHHDRIEAERAGRGGLVRTVGKEFVITNELVKQPTMMAQYGWHDKQAAHVGPGGLAVWQSLDLNPQTPLPHDLHHTDYSSMTTLVHPVCVVNGVEQSTGSVLQDPALAPLLSHEGALKLLRHPAVPEPGIV